MEKDKFGYWVYKEEFYEEGSSQKKVQGIYIKDIKRTKNSLRRLDENDAITIGKQINNLAEKIIGTASKNKKPYHYLIQTPEKRKKDFYVLIGVEKENIRITLPSIEFDKKGRFRSPKRTDNPKEILDFNDLTKYLE